MENEARAGVAAVAALAEPTRRRVYEHVVRQSEPVDRDEVAAAVDLPRTTAAFHLDRLAQCGLLDVHFERRSGRSGPGAGRPSKLYRRAAEAVEVSLPERHYDLAGELLAGAVDEAQASGERPASVLDRHAYRRGQELGEAVRAGGADRDGVLGLRAACGRRRRRARQLPLPPTRPRAHRTRLRHEPATAGRCARRRPRGRPGRRPLPDGGAVLRPDGACRTGRPHR
jgi:DNA-binding transcriptional ArsR family regulator